MGLKIPGFEGLGQQTLDRYANVKQQSQELPRVCDRGYAHEEFEELLDSAEYAAASQWEMDFVQDMVDRFERFGVNTFLSAKQLSVLMKITGED